LLHRLDFSPIVFDDRLEFANTALFPLAERVVLGDFSGIATKVTLTPADYVVIMTRGHHYDHELLTQVLGTPAAYIGLIGSRSKIAHTKSLLFEEGFSEQDFQRVHTPIGLPIKAETPAEIAVSIAAEMILHRASLEAASR
ncbi:MAG: XdhC family protein, partial [Clostridia bacterium]